MSPVGQSNWLIFFIHNSLRTQSGCFIIQLPRRVLRVYWLGYLPGSVLQERAAGASSLVCTGLYYNGEFKIRYGKVLLRLREVKLTSGDVSTWFSSHSTLFYYGKVLRLA